MDHDESSSFATHFQSDVFTLREGGNYQDANLWMSFDPINGNASLVAYDSVLGKDTHTYDTRHGGDVAAFIAAVQKDYGVKVPARFRTLPAEFAALVGDSFGVQAHLEAFTTCEGCGSSNGSTVEAFYFPPLTPEGDASLSLHWDYGCYGGTEIYGDLLPDAKEHIVETLQRAIDTADTSGEYDDAIQSVQDFLDRVKGL